MTEKKTKAQIAEDIFINGKYIDESGKQIRENSEFIAEIRLALNVDANTAYVYAATVRKKYGVARERKPNGSVGKVKSESPEDYMMRKIREKNLQTIKTVAEKMGANVGGTLALIQNIDKNL